MIQNGTAAQCLILLCIVFQGGGGSSAGCHKGRGDVNRARKLADAPGRNRLLLPSEPDYLPVHQAATRGQEACLRVLLTLVNTNTSNRLNDKPEKPPAIESAMICIKQRRARTESSVGAHGGDRGAPCGDLRCALRAPGGGVRARSAASFEGGIPIGVYMATYSGYKRKPR